MVRTSQAGDWLGHANPAITLLVYSHFVKHAESDLADRLADTLLSSPKQ